MASRNTIWMSAAGVGILALGLLVWWFRDEAIYHTPSEAGPGPQIDVDVTQLENVERWMGHLADGGTVRFQEPGDGDRVAVVSLTGLGQLREKEYQWVEAAIQGIVTKRTEELERVYGRPVIGGEPDEKRRLLEAKAQFDIYKIEAYRQALRAGSYFLVESADKTPPLPEGCIGLNVGVQRETTPILCVILVRQRESGLSAVADHVLATERAYLSYLANQFNALSDEERVRQIRRYDEMTPGDKNWRESAFPKGLSIDRAKSIVTVN